MTEMKMIMEGISTTEIALEKVSGQRKIPEIRNMVTNTVM
jgi:hypothetical protein